MSTFLDERVDEIISKVLQRKPLSPDEIVATDQRGQTALVRYIRKTSRMTPPLKLIHTVKLFVIDGFDPYQPNDDGLCSITVLFFKISRDGSRIVQDKMLSEAIQSIVLKYPPPRKLPRHFLYPLAVLFSILALHPTNDQRLMVLRRKLVIFFFTRFPVQLETTKIIDMLMTGIRQQIYDFIDPILSKSYTSFSKRDQARLLLAVLKERLEHAPEEMDDLDNMILQQMLRYSRGVPNDIVVSVARHGDVAALNLILPVLVQQSKNSVLNTLLLHERGNTEVGPAVLYAFCHNRARLENNDTLHLLIERKRIDLVIFLYVNHAISKKQLKLCLETFAQTHTGRRRIQQVLEKSDVLSRFAQASTQQVHQHRTRIGMSQGVFKSVTQMKPDTLKQLSQFLV